MDDLLIIASEKYLCQTQLDLFFYLSSNVGISTAPEKTCGPLTSFSFAAIELDSVLQEVRLPPKNTSMFFFDFRFFT